MAFLSSFLYVLHHLVECCQCSVLSFLPNAPGLAIPGAVEKFGCDYSLSWLSCHRIALSWAYPYESEFSFPVCKDILSSVPCFTSVLFVSGLESTGGG